MYYDKGNRGYVSYILCSFQCLNIEQCTKLTVKFKENWLSTKFTNHVPLNMNLLAITFYLKKKKPCVLALKFEYFLMSVYRVLFPSSQKSLKMVKIIQQFKSNYNNSSVSTFTSFVTTNNLSLTISRLTDNKAKIIIFNQ